MIVNCFGHCFEGGGQVPVSVKLKLSRFVFFFVRNRC